MKGSHLVALVGDSRVVAVATNNVYVIRGEPRLDREGASCPTLTGKAVTDGDPNRIARGFQTKLPTATGGSSRIHRHESYENGG